ncbi:rod shape-determining protein MreC [Candidatus Babeliales bacterium]|nr:rod shape-determining protein MreC [Candidatus Babeliales bacterium]
MSQRILFVFLACALIFFLINRVLFFSPTVLETTISRIMYPFISLQNSLARPIQHWRQQRKSLHELHENLEGARHENENLKAQLAECAGLEHFVQESEEVRSFKDRYSFEQAQLVQVIFRHLSNDEQYYFVDRGSYHGIQKDMVAVYKNCILGRVVSVYPYYSKVRLITDPACPIAVYCKKTKTPGIHVGCRNTQATTIQHVSHLERVKEQDIVLSSGDGLVFPQGFLLGIIDTARVQDMYYAITVTPALDVGAVAYCYLVQKGVSVPTE